MNSEQILINVMAVVIVISNAVALFLAKRNMQLESDVAELQSKICSEKSYSDDLDGDKTEFGEIENA